jgi:hypothetical protein
LGRLVVFISKSFIFEASFDPRRTPDVAPEW